METIFLDRGALFTFVNSESIMGSPAMNAKIIQRLLSNDTALRYIAAVPQAMYAICRSEVAIKAIAKSDSLMRKILDGRFSRDVILNNSMAMDTIVRSGVAMRIIADDYLSILQIANNEMTMRVIAGSEIAMRSIVESHKAISEILKSETAMKAIAQSDVAMRNITTNPTAMKAIAENDMAMRVITDSPFTVRLENEGENNGQYIVLGSQNEDAFDKNSMPSGAYMANKDHAPNKSTYLSYEHGRLFNILKVLGNKLYNSLDPLYAKEGYWVYCLDTFKIGFPPVL